MPAIETLASHVLDVVAARTFDDPSSRRVLASQERPPRYEALCEYQLATEDIERMEHDKGAARLERVLALDPDFLLPYLDLAAYSRYFRSDMAGAARYLSLAEARRDRLPALGRRTLDLYVADFNNRSEQAAVHARALLKLTPGDVYLRKDLARHLALANRPREAVTVLSGDARWDLVLKPDDGNAFQYYTVLATCLHSLGEHERELQEVRKGLARYPDLVKVRMLEAAALAALERTGELEKALRSATSDRLRFGSAAQVFQVAAAELRAHGRREEAKAVASRGLEWLWTGEDEKRRKALRAVSADLLTLAERNEEARETYRELAKEQPHRLSHQGSLACAEARLGRLAEARRVSGALSRLGPPERPYLFGTHTFERARIAAALDERQQAVSLLRAAFSEGLVCVPLASNAFCIHLDPAFEPLRGDPELEELIRPKG
jgi:predicted Zn-dependent protease